MKPVLSNLLVAGVLATSSAPLSAQSPAAAQPAGPRTEVPRKAPAPSGKAAPADEAQAAYWYDGRVRRALRLDPEWIADFGATPAERAAKARAPLQRSGGAEKSPGGPPAGVSPVFRDAGGAPRALPGGVIVRLRPAESPRAQERLAAAGLTPVRAIDAGRRTWLVESAPGLPSLELANRLHEGGAFESAEPNWWRPRALK